MRFILGFVVGLMLGYGLATILSRPGEEAFSHLRGHVS